MPFLIDAHQDIAYASVCFQRDYTLPIAEIRRREPNNRNNQTTLSWHAYQAGNIALIFSTIFFDPANPQNGTRNPLLSYGSPEENHQSVLAQIDFYRQLENRHPDKFRVIHTAKELATLLQERAEAEASAPNKPVGLILLWEGAEGLRSLDDLETYHQEGIRIIGPVWSGGRWCGGTQSANSERFTPEGRQLLQRMHAARYTLDISHMNTLSASEALDLYEGIVIASHCNCQALLKNPENERHLTDGNIRGLIQRGGVMGVIPYNGFLDTNWKDGNPRSQVTLDHLANHIDHICQLAGNTHHAAIGSDLDGGFGFPNIPEEMNDIRDLIKLEQILQRRGYSATDITAIFHQNWLNLLDRILQK